MPLVSYREVTGSQVADYFSDIARLRIGVFREFPYLYDGHLAYEEEYLQTYFSHPESYCVLALEGGRVIGASTGVPFIAEGVEHTKVFADEGIDPERVFYFGESVLESNSRGKGIGKAFFQFRENYARSLERFAVLSFCAVDRPPDHPRRPGNFRELGPFWEKMGFCRRPNLTTKFVWKDLDEEIESPKEMVFWTKNLI